MLDKNKTYLVLNRGGSPVAVSTRFGGYLIPGGTDNEPGSYPFSVDEISQINSQSPVFKTGVLWFETEFQADLYEECRIRDWQNILTNQDFEDIIVSPSADKLQKLLNIEIECYFERAYGVYIGLKNANYPIRRDVENIMTTRRKEFRNNKIKTNIVISGKETPTPSIDVVEFEKTKKQNENLMNEMEQMKAMLEKLMSEKKSNTSEPVKDSVDGAENQLSNVEENIKSTTHRGRPKKNT